MQVITDLQAALETAWREAGPAFEPQFDKLTGELTAVLNVPITLSKRN